MPFSSLELSRFRCFTTAQVRLRPLTIFLGPNSAGKSSFLHALVALRQIHSASQKIPTLDKPARGGIDWPIDFGRESNLATGGTGPVAIAVTTGSGRVRFSFGGAYAEREPGTLGISRVEFSEGSAWEKAATRTGFEAVVDQTSGLPTPGVPLPSGNVSQTGGADTALENTWRHATEIIRTGPETWIAGNQIVRPVFQGIDILALPTTNRTSMMIEFPSHALQNTISALSSLRYLGPNRISPRRRYPSTRSSEIGTCGENAADLLFECGHEAVPAPHVPQLPHSIDDATQARKQFEWNEKYQSLEEGVSRWMTRVGVASNVKASREREEIEINVQMRDGRSHNLYDVGFGVSQVLPVVLASLRLARHGTLAIEHPEAQLHPRSQASLADLFCALSICDRNFVIETHSIDFFNRIRFWAALDERVAKATAVYFVYRDRRGPVVAPVDLTENGELTWPPGFLDDAFESESFIRFARQASLRSP